MRIRRVYIKRSGDEIASEACYSAWRGFSSLGYPLDFFEADDLKHNRLRLDRLTLVVGGTVTVHTALRQIGVAVPEPLNVPLELRSFAGRQIWETTLGEIRNHFASDQSGPVFIKPLVETKSFTGKVMNCAADLERILHFKDSFQLQAAEPVEFVSEWRYYIHRQEVVDVAHYKGAWSYLPHSKVVLQAIATYKSAPIAYSLDFGLTATGETLLVEANDAFALGAHGIDVVAYARMLEDRWLEITGG